MPARVAAGGTDPGPLQLPVSDHLSAVYIHMDLLSLGPKLNLFSEVRLLSNAALTPSFHLTLEFTDQCHLNGAILHLSEMIP